MWWHRFQGVCEHGVLMATTMGESSLPPDELPTREYESNSIGCPEPCKVKLVYVASWDHEPSEEEQDAVAPEGYRDGDE